MFLFVNTTPRSRLYWSLIAAHKAQVSNKIDFPGSKRPLRTALCASSNKTSLPEKAKAESETDCHCHSSKAGDLLYKKREFVVNHIPITCPRCIKFITLFQSSRSTAETKLYYPWVGVTKHAKAPFVNFSVSKISISQTYLLHFLISFIFYKCHRSWVAATPVKYESDIQ